MKGLSAIRRQGISRGRHILGMFLAAWMAVILQPCAVAGEIDHDCPHCPPEAIHEGHRNDAFSGADCVIGGPIGVEARSLQPKPDDLPPQMPIFLGQTFDEIDLWRGSARQFSSARPRTFPGGPPLNVLNCVYLK